jgi:chromosome partitioning protein
MDPQGNLTQHFGFDNESLDKTILHLFQKSATFEEVLLKREECLHILPNNIDTAAAEINLQKSMSREYLLRDVLSSHNNYYDFVFIDCPPSLGLFSINALAASHEFILIVSPEFFPMKAIKPLYETYRMVKYHLNHSLQFNGIMMTMCDFRTRHSQDVLQILKKNFPHKLYRSYIRNNVSLKEASAYGQTIFEYNPASVGAFDYQNFSEEFIRDHHKNKAKRDYYQQKFNSLSLDQQNQILNFTQRNLSLFIKSSLEKLPENTVIRVAFLIERNKVLEKIFPYRANALIESSP